MYELIAMTWTPCFMHSKQIEFLKCAVIKVFNGNNLCNPFNRDLRCASLSLSVSVVLSLFFKKQRREKEAQRRLGLKGLQRLHRILYAIL